MSPIIVILDTSPSSAYEPVRPGDAERGADVAEGRRRRRERVERPEPHTRDSGVDRDDGRADRPDADVEEDEGRDRAHRALLDRRAVETDRHDELGAQRLVDLAAQNLRRAAGGARP